MLSHVFGGLFLVGQNIDSTDYATIGKTGGAENVTLTLEQMPRHNHKDGSKDYLFGLTLGGNDTPQTDKSSNEPNIINAGRLQLAGCDQAHENRPPYYVVAYTQWIGF